MRLTVRLWWIRTKEQLQCSIANLAPDWLVYRIAIRLWAWATSGEYGNTIVSDLTIDEAIKRWEADKTRAK